MILHLENLDSESVTYQDLGVDPKQRHRSRFRIRRRRGPNRKRIQKKDRYSKLQREMRNLRAKILSRLDTIKYRKGDAKQIQDARKEVRTMYQEYKRGKTMLSKLPKPKR